jgi:uncharacterized membrane protein YkvA (DUF1232 family)
MAGRLRRWADEITRDVYAIYLARHDPRVPWYAKALAVCVAAYAVSPIDLIPDFIPILGYADELVILPLGILLVVKMIPRAVMAEYQAAASGGALGRWRRRRDRGDLDRLGRNHRLGGLVLVSLGELAAA